MISLLLGLYASEPISTPVRSCFPSFSKVALVAGITLTYLTTSAYAQNSPSACCLAAGHYCGGDCAIGEPGYTWCNRVTDGKCTRYVGQMVKCGICHGEKNI